MTLVDLAIKWGSGEIKNKNELKILLKDVKIFTPIKDELNDDNFIFTQFDGNSWFDVNNEVLEKKLMTPKQYDSFYKLANNLV